MNPAEAAALFAVVGGIVFVVRPVAAAIAKRIAGEHRAPAMDAAEREEILSELQAVKQELSELAERMDFAERLLAKQGDAGRLPS